MIETMVEELRSVSGKNAKVDILKKHLVDNRTSELVRRCYDPFEKFYIVKVKPTRFGTGTLEDTYDSGKILLDQLSSRQITGNQAKDAVIRYLNILNKSAQNIFMRILSKDLKCGIGAKSINAAIPGLIPSFSVQLANKYSADKNYKVDFWYGSSKYDGIRCLYQTKYPDVLHTREGSALVGFDHIVDDINTLIYRMKSHPVFADMNPDEFFVDGELFSDNTSFNDIQGIVLSTKNSDIREKRTIHLKVFAIGPVKATADMIGIFTERKIFAGLPSLRPIEYFQIENDSGIILAKTRELVSLGYEGLMLRHPTVPYSWNRDNNLLKSKLHHETVAELVITGYKPGKEGTKYANSLGAFACKGIVTDPLFTDGKRLVGEYEVECDVGSGFSDEERFSIWENPEAYIGKEIAVNYQCISKNAGDDSYSLRFPVKKKDGLKLDRTEDVNE